MVALDEEITAVLLSALDLRGKVIADVGCGTGRHWRRLMQQQPAALYGFDISEGMLGRLLEKYPGARVRLISGVRLDGLATASCDLVLSTLAFAHFPDAGAALEEWCRVLRPGGSIILTDGHPVSFEKGADITFASGQGRFAVQHHIYTLQQVLAQANRLGCSKVNLVERAVDASVKHYYEAQGAMGAYKRFEGVPIIYGIHLRKTA